MTTTPEIADKYAPPEKIAFRNKYAGRDMGAGRSVGETGCRALRRPVSRRPAQLADGTVYCKIIRGDLPLSAFDDFVKEWGSRGGDQMTREANELQKEKLQIYQQVGVPKAIMH